LRSKTPKPLGVADMFYGSENELTTGGSDR